MLCLILRKTRSLIAVMLAITCTLIIISYVNTKYLNNSDLKLLFGIMNSQLVSGIIGTIILGIFINGIGLIYQLTVSSIKAHKEAIDKFIFENILSKYNSSETHINVIRLTDQLLALRVSSKLCEAIEYVKQEYSHLWDDLDNHYPEIKQEIENYCNRISRHNNMVSKLNEYLYEDSIKLAEQIRNISPKVDKEIYQHILLDILRKIINELYNLSSKNTWHSIPESMIEEILENYINKLKISKEPDGTLIIHSWRLRYITEEECRNIIVPQLYTHIKELILNQYKNELSNIIHSKLSLENEKKTREHIILNKIKTMKDIQNLPIRKPCKYI